MKKLLLALSSVCLIPNNTLALIGCGDDKASQQQTVKNNINNFLQDSNESDKLLLDKSNASKLKSFGVSYQEGIYQFDNNNLTVEAIKEGIGLLINSNEQLPLIFNAQQTLLDTEAAENETALLVENQDCNIFENNLIYKWNISFYIVKFKNDEFVWVKTSEKSVQLYVEIVDLQQSITEEAKTEEVKTEEVKTEEVKTEEVKTEEVKTEEVKTEEVKTDTVNNDNSVVENNQQIAKDYKETISNWNEEELMLLENKISNTVADLIHGIKENAPFHFKNIDEQIIKNSLIKVKDVNTQKYMQETDYLSAEKYIIEIEFKIGDANSQITETASFEIKISDYNVQKDNITFGCKNSQSFENKDDNLNPEITSTNKLNDSGIESDLDEEEISNESNHNSSDLDEARNSTSADVEHLTIYVNDKTTVKQVIAMIKEKKPELSTTDIFLKNNKNKTANPKSVVKFTNYHVYQDKTTLILNLQVEELIITSNSSAEQMESAKGFVFNVFDDDKFFNIFDDIKLGKIMADHYTAKDLKDMIKATDQFAALQSKIEIKKILEIIIKDKDMNKIENGAKLVYGEYHVEILVLLEQKNTKANILFNVNVPFLSDELSSQLEKYFNDIESTVVKISTKKESTTDKTKCEEKIRNSEEIKNIFKTDKTDKKVIVEHIEVIGDAPYIKGNTYNAKMTFCFDKYENASRKQPIFSFKVE